MIRKYYEYSGLGGGEVRKPLTKEQLLIPRVMCVGGKEKGLTDTSGEFVNGDILTEGKFVKLSGEWYMLTKIILEKICEDFPHLFHLMKWHEARPLVDMPEYIKYGHGAVYKVEDWRENEHYGVYGVCERGEDYPLIMQPQTKPATEQEYLDYQKQKEG